MCRIQLPHCHWSASVAGRLRSVDERGQRRAPHVHLLSVARQRPVRGTWGSRTQRERPRRVRARVSLPLTCSGRERKRGRGGPEGEREMPSACWQYSARCVCVCVCATDGVEQIDDRVVERRREEEEERHGTAEECGSGRRGFSSRGSRSLCICVWVCSVGGTLATIRRKGKGAAGITYAWCWHLLSARRPGSQAAIDSI